MSETVPKCTHWLGHKFEARYSYGEPRALEEKELYWLPFDERAEAMLGMKSETYERDICVRCGLTIDMPTIENVEYKVSEQESK